MPQLQLIEGANGDNNLSDDTTSSAINLLFWLIPLFGLLLMRGRGGGQLSSPPTAEEDLFSPSGDDFLSSDPAEPF